MTGAQPAKAAAMQACRPMPPTPNTARLLPDVAFSTLATAPIPVGAAQPSRTARSIASASGRRVMRFSLTRARRWKVVIAPAFTRLPFQS